MPVAGRYVHAPESRILAASLFSVTATCKRLGLDPFAYLRDVLDRVATHPARRVGLLLPGRWRGERTDLPDRQSQTASTHDPRLPLVRR